VLDLEDLNEQITLNEFTLDDFRMDLLKYIQRNRRLLAAAPLGLYAVVPPHPDYALIAPGVIFCLRQQGGRRSSEINPLHPYYLVYVRDDGEVRLGFAQPRQILEIYRVLCAEQAVPYEELCRLFDQHTQDGADMAHYSDLLERAVQSVTRTFQRRMALHMLAGRGGQVLPQEEQVDEESDFELVTWLVVQKEA
jgi:hypothetical protein